MRVRKATPRPTRTVALISAIEFEVTIESVSSPASVRAASMTGRIDNVQSGRINGYPAQSDNLAGDDAARGWPCAATSPIGAPVDQTVLISRRSGMLNAIAMSMAP